MRSGDALRGMRLGASQNATFILHAIPARRLLLRRGARRYRG